jgi:Phage portal protein
VSSPPTRTSSPAGPRRSRNAGRPATKAAAASPSWAQAPASRPCQSPPEEAQFLETTQANIRTICRYFGVQPELIGADSGNSLTYANVEQRALDFLTFGLRPWLVRLETALSHLLSSTTTVKFNAAALVRTDLLTRYQAHESAIRAGWKLRSEVREARGLAPDPRHRRPEGTGGLMIHVRSYPASLALRDDGDGRTLHGPLLPWGVEARVVDRGRLVVETFQRGALDGTDPARVPLTATHPRDAGSLPIGRTSPSTTGRMPPGASGWSRIP